MSITFRPNYDQSMAAGLTCWLGKNAIFSDQKQILANEWIDAEIDNASPFFDNYTTKSMKGMMMRCLFLGAFLEKSIDCNQMAILK